MRTTSVRSTTEALVSVFALSALLFAWNVRGEGPDGALPIPGAQAFRRSCAHCHDPAELGAPLHDGRAVLDMLRFLDDHGNELPREDRAIVAYLLDHAH